MSIRWTWKIISLSYNIINTGYENIYVVIFIFGKTAVREGQR